LNIPRVAGQFAGADLDEAMTTARNATCPCGSGKKYKKCCLAKDEAAARAATLAAARAAEEERQAEEAAQRAEWEKQQEEWQQRDTDKPTASPSESTVDGPDWPPLSEADQQLVDAWWKEAGPVYMGRDRSKECGRLLDRVLAFLDQHPRLFRYLYLHEELLFELGASLARADRMGDYLELLRRLRDEQPEMYFQCFGYYDEDLLTEALRTGRREEIPACLRLFREHPSKHIDQFARVVDLLAWRGCETELKELLEPTAHPVADSPDVLGGAFGLQWLADLAIFPFLEAGDDSPPAVDRMCEVARDSGYLSVDDTRNRDWLARMVILSSRSPAEACLDLKDTRNERLHEEVGWSFAGWLRRTKGLTWSSARFLSNALADYWAWREDRKKPTSSYGLSENRLDHYLAQRCRDFICLNGVSALSTLQAFHYLTEYLVAHGYFNTADALQLQAAAGTLYETIRDAVDSCDSGYRICPTYEALIAAPPLVAEATGNPMPS
jgi:hypothetical protein